MRASAFSKTCSLTFSLASLQESLEDSCCYAGSNILFSLASSVLDAATSSMQPTLKIMFRLWVWVARVRLQSRHKDGRFAVLIFWAFHNFCLVSSAPVH